MLGLFHKETEEEKRQKRLAKLGDRLVRAAEQGDEAEMQDCLEEGAAAAYVDRYGFNALMHAAKEGHVAASRLLLQSSAEVNAAHAEDGATALHLAACGGETACLGLLLEAGADCALCMKDGSTAPMLAAMVGLESALRIFSAHGVDLKPLRGMEGLSEGVRELLDEQQAERQPSAPGDASAATLPVVSLEVEDGSAGFTCEKGGLSVIRLDEGGAAAAAGVVVGMRCVAFQSAALPDGMTWAELKARVKAAPKPWRFRFAAVEVPTGPPVLLDDGGTASWATSTEAAGAGSEFTAHESISRGIALAQVADLSRVTDAQLEEYRAALRAELSRADAERASRDAAAVAEAAAESASASRVGDAMAQLGHPIAQYASLFASLSITVELMEALGDDEENWSELFGEGCDLEAVNPSDRAALVAAVPAIAAAASIGGGDNTTDC